VIIKFVFKIELFPPPSPSKGGDFRCAKRRLYLYFPLWRGWRGWKMCYHRKVLQSEILVLFFFVKEAKNASIAVAIGKYF